MQTVKTGAPGNCQQKTLQALRASTAPARDAHFFSFTSVDLDGTRDLSFGQRFC
ncbi:MAG: hypothetical protein ABI651_04500 [Verrucomicrobiota bacterium]